MAARTSFSRRSRNADEARGLARQLAAREGGGHAQAGDGRDVLGAGAAVALVLAAREDRRDARAALDPEGAGTLRTVELVRRERQQVSAEGAHVHGNLGDRLHGIGVEERATRVRDARQVGDRLHRADLVVGVHDRDERRLVGHRRLEGLRRDDPARVDGEQGRRPAPASQRLEGGEDGLVLDGAGDEVPASGDLECLGDAAKREVVGLRAATREDDLGDLCLQEVGDRRACLVQDSLGPLTKMVNARRIAELVAEHTRHGLQDGRREWGRGVMVEVDAHR